MRNSRILAKLRKNELAALTQLHFVDESCWELASLSGVDGIWMDLEHHFYSAETAARMIRATRVGDCDVVARCARGEFMRFARLLEAGAAGIMYPRCEDAEEAAEIVRNTKFAPLGIRGFDGGNPDMPYCSMGFDDYLKQANEETFVVVQIESPKALENVEEIAAVEGVQVLFFGPADFSVLSGIPGRFEDSRIKDAMRRISKAAEANGIHWGMPMFTLDHGKELTDLGARFLAHQSDLVMVKRGVESVVETFEKLGFQKSDDGLNRPGTSSY
ncbi:MAG: aldolase/citrate lyase family protein [Planctomycetota bacterium]